MRKERTKRHGLRLHGSLDDRVKQKVFEELANAILNRGESDKKGTNKYISILNFENKKKPASTRRLRLYILVSHEGLELRHPD